MRTLVDAETGERGFVLTGKDEFLQPYNQTLQRLDGQMATLQEKTKDNPRQQENIKQLQAMVVKRLALLKEGIDLRRKSEQEAKAFIATGKGKAQMDAIRTLVAEMDQEEHDLLLERERQSHTTYTFSLTTGLFTVALGVFMVGMFYRLLLRNLIIRQKATDAIREKQEWLRTTMASIGDGVIASDTEGKVAFLNGVATTLTGWKESEAEGQPLETVFHIVNEETRRPVEDPTRRVLRDGVVVGLANHTVLIARDASERAIEDSAAPIRRENGEIIGVVLVFRDATKQRQLEQLQNTYQVDLERQVRQRTEQMRASEERLRLVVDGTKDHAIFMLDPTGKVVSWNPGAERIKQYRAEEIVGQHFSRFYPATDVESGTPARGLRLAETEGRFEDEGWRVRKDGTQFWASVVITALRDEAGNLRGFSKVTRDITERKRAEENAHRLLQEQAARLAAEEYAQVIERQQAELRVNQERLTFVLQATGLGLWLNTLPLGNLTWDERQRGLFFVPPGVEPTIDLFWKRLHPDDREPTRRAIEVALRDHTLLEIEHRVVDPTNGDVRWLRAAGKATYDEGGKPIRFDGINFDITARKLAEDRERQGQRFSQAVLDSLPAQVAVLDEQGTIIGVNKGWSDFSRQDACLPRTGIGTNYLAVCRGATGEGAEHARAAEQGIRAVLDGSSSRFTLEYPCHSPTEQRWFLMLAVPLPGEQGRGLTMHFEITDRKKAEEQFRQSQKMEAIGQLAGGVAHDFNNLLTVINGYSDILSGRLPERDEQARGMVQQIRKSGERAAALTQQLLAYSRQQILQPKVFSLNELVANLQKMLVPMIGEDVALATALSAKPCKLRADFSQLEQVVMNLAVNARDAMPQGGKFTIETSEVQLDEGYTRRFAELRPGPYVLLAVTDTGSGMDQETLSHLFEPFFTTKEQGKGTGLGLAMVYGIVKQSNGHIRVYSELGHGTTFKIYLPSVENETDGSEEQTPSGDIPSGTETILLVEDEEGVRALARCVLQEAGYKVLDAASGTEALEIIARHSGPIDLLVTDVVMPQMSGPQVAQALLLLHPGLRVLFMSGYTDDTVVRHGLLAGEMAFLQKPFTMSALAHKLREVLDKKGDEKDPPLDGRDGQA